MKCPSCGFENPAGFKFCGACGAGMTAVPAAATPMPATAPATAPAPVPAAPSVPPSPAAAGDERRTVTILFADISGFTAMSEKLDPEVVQEIMDHAFERLTAVITGFGGTIDKYIGDAIMALFGAPVALGDDPERAVRAGLGMQRVMAEYSEELKRARGFPLAMRVGINTGKVIWGRVGGTGEKSFTVMGDAVNLASRLEHAAPIGGVLIGESTSRHVRTVFAMEALEPIAVKGKAELQRTYLVSGEVSGAARATMVGPRTPFVGRDEEMVELNAALAAVKGGASGGVFTVEAPAGTGKSRMVLELRSEAEERSVATLSARAAPFGQGAPFAPWADLFQRAASLGKLSPAAARERLAAWLEETAPGSGVDPRWIYELASVVDPGDAEAQRRREHPSRFRKGVQESAAAFLTAFAKRQPLFLLAEDLHWWPAPSLELLSAVATVAAHGPMLIVATRRPEALQAAWPPPGTNRVLSLQPLDHTALHSLTRGVLGHEVPPGLVASLESISGGNPFFAEELIQAYIDRGALHTSAERAGWVWDQAKAERLDLPTTVEGVTQARIDALPAREKHVLQMAAVAGRSFWEGLLVAMGEAAANESLMHLVGRDLVHARRSRLPAEKEYTFKHATIQSVAYENHLKRDRVADHRRVAEWLEPRVGKDSIEFAPILAEHYLQADEKVKALPFLLTAAEEQVRASVKLENAMLVEQGAAVAEELGEPHALTRALRYRGKLRRIGSHSGAEADLRRAMELGASVADEFAVAEAGVELAGALYYRGAAQEADEVAQKTLLAARLAKSTRCEVLALNMLGMLAQGQGDYTSARRFYDAGLETARGASDHWHENFMLGTIVHFHSFLGEYHETIEAYSRVDPANLARENLAFLRSNAGAAYLGIGDAVAADSALGAALADADEIGLRVIQAEARIRLGSVRHLQGRNEEAAGLFRDGMRVASEANLPEQRIEGLVRQAQAEPNPDLARAKLSEARGLAAREGNRAFLQWIETAEASLSSAAPRSLK